MSIFLIKQFSDFLKKIIILHTILYNFIGIINMRQSVECMIDKKSENNLVFKVLLSNINVYFLISFKFKAFH